MKVRNPIWGYCLLIATRNETVFNGWRRSEIALGQREAATGNQSGSRRYCLSFTWLVISIHIQRPYTLFYNSCWPLAITIYEYYLDEAINLDGGESRDEFISPDRPATAGITTHEKADSKIEPDSPLDHASILKRLIFEQVGHFFTMYIWIFRNYLIPNDLKEILPYDYSRFCTYRICWHRYRPLFSLVTNDSCNQKMYGLLTVSWKRVGSMKYERSLWN